jgi:hypothetical protein
MIYTTTISESSEYGITAAREAYNASLPKTVKDGDTDVPNPALLAHDTAYLDFVLQSAVQSWCRQYAPVVVPDVPIVSVNGVPQSVPRRQAKTVMELTPNATHGNLWLAALAAAGAIPDAAQRIITTNYLLESLYFEHPKVSQLAIGLLGMKQDQVDALFVAAAKL